MNSKFYHSKQQNSQPAFQRITLSFAAGILVLMLSFTACKKEKDEDTACKAVAKQGRLSYTNASGPYTFRTNGGGTIIIDPGVSIIIKHDNYPGFKIELWGDTTVNGQVKTSGNHENLNGKHIKDRIDSRRTIIFPDGAKITLIANGYRGPLQSVSIYDGAESHTINTTCNTLVHSSTSLTSAQERDNAEADGETAAIEFNSGTLLFVNIYTEDTPGNKVNNRVKLGETFQNNPNLVNDYYDDPRLGHT